MFVLGFLFSRLAKSGQVICHKAREARIAGVAAFLALTFLGCPTAAAEVSAAFQQACERNLPPSQIIITAPASAVRYNYAESAESITRRSGGDDMTGLRQTTIGLTETHYEFSSHLQAPMLTDPQSGVSCIRAGIGITILTGPQVVSIASEFPPGTCPYREILQHEMRHVRANQDKARSVAADFEARMRAFYGQRVFYGSADGLREQLGYAVQAQWLRLMDQSTAQVRQLHAAIDTFQEYARMNTVCDGEIPRRLAQTRAGHG